MQLEDMGAILLLLSDGSLLFWYYLFVWRARTGAIWTTLAAGAWAGRTRSHSKLGCAEPVARVVLDLRFLQFRSQH
jgi:hypothetical protein